MNVTASPDPFPAASGFDIDVDGGTPPYTYEPYSPPPGVTVSGGHVSVPAGTAPGTVVRVKVTDSSSPPQSKNARSTVA